MTTLRMIVTLDRVSMKPLATKLAVALQRILDHRQGEPAAWISSTSTDLPSSCL